MNWHCIVCCGMVWYGRVFGMAWTNTVWQCRILWYSRVYGMAWVGMVWRGRVYDMAW